jgi:hypothetical protein
MSFEFPKITATFDDETTVEVEIRKIDLLRLERSEKISLATVEFGLDQMYKLTWLALQRTKNEHVAPHLDLSSLPLDRLCAGVDALAEIADIEAEEAAEVGKSSAPDQPTG